MAPSPALSPRPNPPGTRIPPAATATKAKALALLNSNKTAAAPAPAAAETLGDGGLDLAEQMNDEVRRQFVSGAKLGEGTYAIVYAGHYRNNPSALVAIKKIKVNAEFKDGIAPDAIREIKFLSELSHPNIVKLHAVYATKEQNLSLVLEHLPLGDLDGLWRNKSITFGGADIKAWANMICQGIWFCHENFVLHRDIKGGNILIAADGTLKLADFGLARSFADPGKKMTTLVITRSYRPPELFYGCSHYGGTADMWSIGCTIAELAIRNYFLIAGTDIEELALLCDTFGTPTEETWPGVSSLPYYVAPGKKFGQELEAKGTTAAKVAKPMSWWRSRFPLLGEDGLDLVRGMMTMDPQRRLTARQALQHKYWTNLPRPTKKENLPGKGRTEEKPNEEAKRKGGDPPPNGRGDKVARKLDFGAMG